MLQIALFLAMAATQGQVVATKQPYCALSVTVSDSQGNPLDDIPASVSTPDGLEVVKGSSKRGEIEFCGLGLRNYELRVGFDQCGQTVVRNISFHTSWPDVLRLRVVLNRCGGEVIYNQCVYSLRIKNRQGKLLPGFVLRSDARGDIRSDVFGRVFVMLSRGQSETVSAVKGGDKPIQLTCTQLGFVLKDLDFTVGN